MSTYGEMEATGGSEPICPECGRGCNACYNAGKSHTVPLQLALRTAQADLASITKEWRWLLREVVEAANALLSTRPAHRFEPVEWKTLRIAVTKAEQNGLEDAATTREP